MIPKAAMLAACAALSACVAPDAGNRVHLVSYETGPCFGACPVYRVLLSEDGAGTFASRPFNEVTSIRDFRVTRAQFRRFVRHLAPLRPAGVSRYAGEACTVTATDMPSVEVSWYAVDQSAQQLYFDFGCDMERNRAIADRLTAAPSLLPIGDFIRAAR